MQYINKVFSSQSDNKLVMLLEDIKTKTSWNARYVYILSRIVLIDKKHPNKIIKLKTKS